MNKADVMTLARYNLWANNRVFDTCYDDVSDSDYFADKGAFFLSIHGTLNHILVGDLIWTARLKGTQHAITRLDTILFDTVVDLRKGRQDQDDALLDHVSSLSDDDVAANVTYKNLAGEAFNTPHGLIIQHMVNHATHHRGQVHTLLTQSGYTAPVLDMAAFFRSMD